MAALDTTWVAGLRRSMPRQAELLERLMLLVDEGVQDRALIVSCSLGRGNGDMWSDIDAGLRHTILDEKELEGHAAYLAERLGDVVGMYIHDVDGFGQPTRRLAAEYATGVQLDLVLMPTTARAYHCAGEEVVLVDKGNQDVAPFHTAGRRGRRANRAASERVRPVRLVDAQRRGEVLAATLLVRSSRASRRGPGLRTLRLVAIGADVARFRSTG